MIDGAGIDAAIDTARLHLRPYCADDLQSLYELTLSPRMREHLGGDPPSRAASFDRLLRTAGGWSLFGYSTFAVIERETGALVGNCGLFRILRELGPDFDAFPEAGWIIAESRWGRGYAREAMDAAHTWFDGRTGRQRTVCMIAPGNMASEHLAAKLSYRAFRDSEHRGGPVRLYAREAA